MIASLTQASDEILARLKLALADVDNLEMVYDDVSADTPGSPASPATVPSLTSWLYTQIDYEDARHNTIGGTDGHRRKRYEGVLMARLFTPHGDGKRLADSIGQTIMTAFDTGGPTAGGVQFVSSTPRNKGRKGAWHESAILVEFTFDMMS